MNPLNHRLSSKTEADLPKLVEPLAAYIAASRQPRVVLITALILLLDNLQEINKAANHYLGSFSEDYLG